ncbi:MAG TPA: FGGY family carbohydrate kinase, partial [Candidatus Limnocylindrales bacterium]
MTDAVLGIDLGTTEARAGVFDLTGNVLGIASAGYPTDRDETGRAEQDPSDWWAAAEAAIRGAVVAASERGAGGPRGAQGARGARGARSIAAICGVGQGPTLVAVDRAGDPVRPAITWQDRRAGDGGFGLLPRIAWLAAREPEAVERARWLMTSWDALGLWLSG